MLIYRHILLHVYPRPAILAEPPVSRGISPCISLQKFRETRQ